MLAIIVALVVIAAIAVTAAFAWNRWYRYDDAADIQGKWYPVGSTEAISIGPDAITFNDDVSYEYTLDAGEKTLSYRLGPLEGKGHYWFSDDRESLVIWDGDAFTPTDTAFDDLARTLSEVGASLEGAEMALPEGEGVSAFTRQADPELVARKAEAERQAREAEEAKARAEQEAAEAEARAAEEAQSEEAQEFANESMGIIE